MRETAGLFPKTILFLSIAVGSWAIGTRNAAADTEPPGVYDARSTAMGGTGTAFIDGAAAIYHNPANMKGFKKISVIGAVSPLLLKLQAPVEAPNTEKTNSKPIIPFFFGGVAYRLTDSVTLGAGAYLRSGFGSEYEDLAAFGGETIGLTLTNIEIAAPINIEFADWVSMGLGIRIVRTQLDSELPSELAGGAIVDLSATGWGGGAYVGLHFKPLDMLRLAVVYRSKTSIDLSGDSDVPGLADNVPTDSEWNSPHVLRLGSAVSLLEDKLLVAADFQVKFFKNSTEELVVELEAPGVPPSVTPLQWRNAYNMHLGAEYWLLPFWAVRAGYSLTRSATPKSAAFPFALPPGLIHNPTVGVGFKFWRMNLDLGFSYAYAEETIDEPSINGGLPGTYREDGFLGSVSLAYNQ